MKMSEIFNTIIIGSGPAGLTAAIYAARANLNPLVFAGLEKGGQLMLTTEVENYPGFRDGILGPELMVQMEEQAKRFGSTIRYENIASVDFSQKPLVVKNENSQFFKGKTVIIATGASSLWLGLENETRLRGRGVSGCATCDGYFFKDKRIVVIGGGDSAMEEAIFLTKFASSVTVIHRRDTLRASKIMQERARNNPKISFVWNSVVTDILGKEKVEGVQVENIETGQVITMPIEGVFLAIGHSPNTQIFKGAIDLDEKGYVMTEDGVHTSKEGVFVAGDVHDFVYRQAITAAGDGCRAALMAEKYLEHMSIPTP